jgi:uncharacterized protein
LRLSAYRPSRYNFFVPLKDDFTLAYNSLGNSLAVWDEYDRKVYDILCCGGDRETATETVGNDRYLDSILKDLKKGSFIIEKKTDEREKIDEAVKLLRFGREQLTLTIAPTLKCNFGCDYCYQGNDRTGRMTDSVRDALVGFVERASHDIKSLGVAWYGGEPLLEPDIVERLSERFIALCGERNISYSAMMVTNGFLLTKETSDIFKRCRISSVQVTLDGDRPVHDTRRILLGGGPTFDRIIGNLADVTSSNEELHISIRVNVDRRNCDSIEALIDRMCAEGLNKRKNLSMYFAPVDVCSSECLKIADNVMPMQEYAALEAELARLATERGMYFPSMPNRAFSLCAAVKPNGFVILPNGDIHKCWNTVSNSSQSLCRIDEIDCVWDSPLQREWLEHELFSMPECDDCEALANCAGGCANKAMMGYANPCISLKYNMEKMLALYAVSKGAIKPEDVLV